MTDTTAAAPAAEAATPVEMKSRAVSYGSLPKEEAPAPEPTEPVEQAQEAEPEGEEPEGGNTDESAPSDGDDAPAGRKNKGVGKRINELTREKYEALRRVQELEAKLASASSGQPADSSPPPAQATNEATGEPRLEDFEFDVSKFNRAHYQWMREQERKQETAHSTLRTLREKEAAFTAEFPDYEEVAKAPHVPVNAAMAEAMLGTDNPPAVAYYLGQNLDEAAAIAKQSPVQAAISIGRIAERLSATKPPPPPAPPKKTTNAPPPPKTVSGAAPAQVSVDDPSISTAQRIALWKQQKGSRS